MEKREIKKSLDAAFKEECLKRQWRVFGGRPYWIEDNLLFKISGDFNGGRLRFTLTLKSLLLDKMLWTILGFDLNKLKSNLHLNGAFVLQGKTIDESFVEVGTTGADLMNAVGNYCDFSQGRARKVGELIVREGFIVTLGSILYDYSVKYPRVNIDFDVERVLWHLMHKEFSQAKELALLKIAAKKSGGFVVENKTFFQLAVCYIEKELNNISS